jgi:hypothetical protein
MMVCCRAKLELRRIDIKIIMQIFMRAKHTSLLQTLVNNEKYEFPSKVQQYYKFCLKLMHKC